MHEEMRKAARKVNLFNYIYAAIFAVWLVTKQFVIGTDLARDVWESVLYAFIYAAVFSATYVMCKGKTHFLRVLAYVSYPVFTFLVWNMVNNTEHMYSSFFLLAIPLIEMRHLLGRKVASLYSFITLFAYMYSFYRSGSSLTWDEAVNNVVLFCTFMLYITFSIMSMTDMEIKFYEKMKTAQDTSYKIHREKENINFMYENVKSLSGVLDLEEIARRVDKICGNLVWHKNFILVTLLDEKSSTFLFHKFADGDRKDSLENFEYDFVRKVLAEGRTLREGDMFGMPLHVSGSLIGAMIMQKYDEEVLSERYHLLHVLGDQVALVVDNAKKFLDKELESITDELTGTYNKKHFHRVLESLVRLEPDNLYLLLYDIDYFKKFNDTFGHRFGDIVLAETAKIVQGVLRDGDFLARYGGEEFAVLFEAPDDEKALAVAERIRRAVEQGRIENPETGKEVSVTISVGVGRYKAGWSAEKFIEHVDRCLYESKRAGRNRTTIYVDV